MALAALLPGVLSYTAYSYLQRELGAARTALLLYLSPVYGALGAFGVQALISVLAGARVPLAARMSEISAASQEQSQGVSQIGAAVTEMDQVTQQNTAMVEETSAASASLAMESAKLRELVRRFDLGQQRPVATLSRQSSHGTVRRYG